MQVHLKAHGSLFANGLVVRLWIYKTDGRGSNPPGAAYCNSICNKAKK